MTTTGNIAPKTIAAQNAGILCAVECIDIAVHLNNRHVDSKGAAPLNEESRGLADLLADITEFEVGHPAHQAFVGKLNKLNDIHDTTLLNLVDFESALDLANYINLGRPDAFATVRGKHGIDHIVRLENKMPPVVLPALTPLPLSDSIDFSPLSLTRGARKCFPELMQLPAEGSGDPLITANPRTEATLQWIVDTLLATTSETVNELVYVEHGPRLAIGAMVLAARMGMHVLWTEIAPQGYLHTSHQLMRLPQNIRERISYLPQGEYANANIALWNAPLPNTGFLGMGIGLANGGMLMLQSERTFEPHVSGWRLHFDIQLEGGAHVLHSSFLHIQPRTFQVWSNFAK